MVASFLYGEVAALCRGQSENGEEVRSDLSGWNCLRRRAVVQPDDRGTARARANILKDIAPKIAEVLHRAIAQVERCGPCAVFIQRFEDPNQSFCAWEGQRPQQRAFDDREDGGVRPDSERERGNGDETEAG